MVFGVGLGLKNPKVGGAATLIGWFPKVVGAANGLFFRGEFRLADWGE